MFNISLKYCSEFDSNLGKNLTKNIFKGSLNMVISS